MVDSECIGLVSDEAQAGQIVLVEPEDGLVRPNVVEDDVRRVSTGRGGQETVEPRDDPRRAAERIEVDDAVEPQ